MGISRAGGSIASVDRTSPSAQYNRGLSQGLTNQPKFKNPPKTNSYKYRKFEKPNTPNLRSPRQRTPSPKVSPPPPSSAKPLSNNNYKPTPFSTPKPRGFAPPTPNPRMPPPTNPTPSPPPGAGAAAAAKGFGNIASKLPGWGKPVAAVLLLVPPTIDLYHKLFPPSKPETAGMYPGTGGSIPNGSAGFTGGQMSGYQYNVVVECIYQFTASNASILQLAGLTIIGAITSVDWVWIYDSSRGWMVSLVATNAQGETVTDVGNRYVRYFTTTNKDTKITDIAVRVYRPSNAPDTGGNPPAPTIQYSSPNISPGVSGTTGADGKPYIGTLSTTEGGKPSSSNTPSGIERKPRMSPPPLKDYDFPDPPPVPDPEEQYKNGTFPGGSKSSKGGSDTDGQYKPSPNLGDFGGDKTWFDTNGNVQKGGLKPHTNSSTNWTSVTPSPSGTHETTPKGDLEPNVTTPEKTYTPPPTTPKPTDTPDNTPDLTKFLPLIALAPSMDKKLDKIDDTVTQIKNEPKSPCLAPVYVPPVSAKVDTNISLTNTLQGVTIAQGETTRNAVNAVSNTVNTVNTKLGTQIVNGGIGGTLTRLYKVLHVDRVMNTMNTFLLVHNAVMLSRGIASTLTEVIDNSLDIAGFKFKNAEGEDAEISEVISGTLKSWIISIIGANNYTTTD
jgi:hypothetical protein